MKKYIYCLTAVLCGFSISASEQIKQKRKFAAHCKKPNLSDNHIAGYSMGIRPCRISGIRLEIEHFKNKVIIHNYGHGGSGITLSWGCAHRVVQLLEQEIVKMRGFTQQPVVVLGAGIIGLSVAHELLDKGYKVTVYAEEFSPNVATSFGQGAVRPFGLGQEQDLVQFKELYHTSLKYFERYASEKNPEFCGVERVADFAQSKGLGEHANQLVVNVPIYVNDLFNKAQKKGAQFVHKIFATKEEVAQLPEAVIINCTGYGARDLFADQDVYPIRGIQ